MTAASFPTFARPSLGAAMTKSPVTGFRRLNRARATSDTHAESVALAHWALGIDAEIPGLSAENAASRFSFVRAPPPIKRSAAGSTVMLLAVGTNPVSASVR